MISTYKLLWSEEAVNGLKDIISYLEHKFSEKEIRKFVKKLDNQLEIILTHPETYPISISSNIIRRCIVARLTSIYYTVEEDTILIVTIIDNRKDHQRLKMK